MIIAGLGVLAALAFVLGLGAFALWGVKRFSGGSLLRSPRTRVPVEIVQRVSLGPKTGLAVVRVGEKVMAVSIGDGGIRTLFELDEADRQRVIATSTIPVQMTSSAEATARMTVAKNPAQVYASQAPAPDREFLAILGMSLRNTTRLAAFVGAVVLSGATASEARAQGEPPVPPVQQPPVAPPVQEPVLAPIPPAALQISAPTTNSATPRVAIPASAITAPRTANVPALAGQPPRTTGAASATRPARPGNGASVTRGGAAATRPMSDMRFDSAAANAALAATRNPRAVAATPAPIGADDAIMRMMPQMDVKLGETEDGGLRLNGTVGIVVMMGLLTLLPTLMLMMTGFTRILIVLHFLKQAMGTQGAPPAHLLAGLALLLTGFVMAPTLTQVNREAVTPWLDGKMTQVEMLKTGVKPMREFMVRQTRQSDIKTFVEMSRMPQPDSIDDVPLHVLMSAFVASELRTAFQIGFAIYLPFIIIDTVVASVLMSMGMFMLPPAMISLPFKLLLFVLVDGWSLTIQSLVQSFK
ncbi:MAG: flagellar type III secretion system pore protein FliP [Gemmatimonadota bacterium]